MSQWVHLIGAIHIETFGELTKGKLKRKIEKIIRKAPKITGSEVNVDMYVNIEKGYDIFGYHNGVEEKYQSRAIITLQGDLRDRTPQETKVEVNNFLKYISEQFSIRVGCIIIENEICTSKIIIPTEEEKIIEYNY